MRDAMYAGEKINVTEGRAVLHVALRACSRALASAGSSIAARIAMIQSRFPISIYCRVWPGYATRKAILYKDAGVSIDEADRAVDRIKRHARATFHRRVLTDIGSFGAGFHLSGWKSPVLVSSADGVGTKLKAAFLSGRHNTVGEDALNSRRHCGTPPVRRLYHIHIEIVIGKNGTSRGRHTDRDSPDIHLVDYLCNEPMDNTVAATGTVMKGGFLEALRMLKDFFHEFRRSLITLCFRIDSYSGLFSDGSLTG
jgi:hypothetical protein